MAKPATKKTPPAAGKDHVRLVVQVRADQVQGLVAEAERRREPGQVRADVSAVARDAFDAFLARKAKR
jgi:hypothetical protein